MNSAIIFRKATGNDVKPLSNLAYNSEKYLGYSLEYMEKFSAYYNVTEDFIRKHLVYVMENEKEIVGFWGLSNSDKDWELEFFYIAPEYIGKGWGQILWRHLVTKCKEQDILKFQLVTSPQSTRFYEKMGAIVITQVESLLEKGRMIPKLEYVILT